MRARFYRTAVSAAVLMMLPLVLAGTALAVTIASFTPTSGLTQTPSDGSQCAGAVIAITGTGFVDEKVSGVSFNGVASPYVNVGSNVTVYAMVPDKATTGPISVTTSAGTATSATNFTVNACPYTASQVVKAPATTSGAAKATVTTFTPAKAKAGAKVTITGTGFIGATGVKIGGVKATFKIVSGTKITATVPAKAKSGKISVTNSAGTTTSSKSFVKA
jgi:hypothetical protein